MGVSNKSLEIAIKVTKCEKQSFPGRVRRSSTKTRPPPPIITRESASSPETTENTDKLRRSNRFRENILRSGIQSGFALRHHEDKLVGPQHHHLAGEKVGG